LRIKNKNDLINTKHKKLFLLFFLIGFPIILLCFFVFNNIIIHWVQMLHLPACVFYKRFSLYCPSCGNTRSVLSLLRGDVFASLKYNITPVFFLILTTAFYIEALIYVIAKKKIDIVPRRISLLVEVLISFAVYFIVRNFLLYLI